MARAELAQRPWVEHVRPRKKGFAEPRRRLHLAIAGPASVKDPATALEELSPRAVTQVSDNAFHAAIRRAARSPRRGSAPRTTTTNVRLRAHVLPIADLRSRL